MFVFSQIPDVSVLLIVPHAITRCMYVTNLAQAYREITHVYFIQTPVSGKRCRSVRKHLDKPIALYGLHLA